MINQKGIKEYANRMCSEGRNMVNEGITRDDHELKSAGLKVLAEGLIQQNPLRDRPSNVRSYIFGCTGVEIG